MKLSEARSKCRNPQAFGPSDRYMIVNSKTREPLEGHVTEDIARYFRDAVNNHEIICNREAVYEVELLA